ncbi:MAG: proton-conducting transporter membrane subunit [Halomonas sp.]|nr:proton-conducting transporter membrane subunit [Halomonas sp.]MDZ7852579.1 proton-conducting transporter membrane subunit [Halomonas sp.]
MFLEIAAIASYGILAIEDDENSLAAGFKYVIAGGISSAVLLLGTIFLYRITGTLNIDGMIAWANANAGVLAGGAGLSAHLPRDRRAAHRAQALPGKRMGARCIPVREPCRFCGPVHRHLHRNGRGPDQDRAPHAAGGCCGACRRRRPAPSRRPTSWACVSVMRDACSGTPRSPRSGSSLRWSPGRASSPTSRRLPSRSIAGGLLLNHFLAKGRTLLAGRSAGHPHHRGGPGSPSRCLRTQPALRRCCLSHWRAFRPSPASGPSGSSWSRSRGRGSSSG